jgi:hypothetical protein
MKYFATATLIAMSFASQASAFSLDLSLPSLTFPPAATTLSSENCAPTATQICK